MIKYRKEVVEKEVVDDIICNICGKSTIDIGKLNHEYVTLSGDFGFYSGHDGIVVQAHVCVNCYYEKIVSLFTISSVVENIWDPVEYDATE